MYFTANRGDISTKRVLRKLASCRAYHVKCAFHQVSGCLQTSKLVTRSPESQIIAVADDDSRGNEQKQGQT
jgi:hypothetical protein